MTSISQTTSGAALHEFLRRIIVSGEQLYGVVDSARDRELADAAWARFDLKRWSLFDSDADPAMSTVAPYLVTFGMQKKYPYPGSGYLDLWAERLGMSAGILLISGASVRLVWEQMRDIFLVTDEQRNEFFFRYYDPRVLRAFLPTCAKAQAREFFGCIRCMIIESKLEDTMLVSTCESSGVKIVELPISAKQDGRVG